jgi:hypothetical protein
MLQSLRFWFCNATIGRNTFDPGQEPKMLNLLRATSVS